MKLTDIAEFNPSSQIQVKNLPFINYIDAASAINGVIENVACLTADFPSRAQRLVKEGDILISSVRPNLLHNCQIDNLKENMVASTGYIQIRTKSDKIDSKYLFLNLPSCVVFGDHSCTIKYVNFPFARGADGTQIIDSNVQSVTNLQLYFAIKYVDFDEGYKRHFSALKDMYIVIPPTIGRDGVPSPSAAGGGTPALPMWKQVSDKLFANVRFQRQQINALARLRDFLLPMLMNGQVEIGS